MINYFKTRLSLYESWLLSQKKKIFLMLALELLFTFLVILISIIYSPFYLLLLLVSVIDLIMIPKTIIKHWKTIIK